MKNHTINSYDKVFLKTIDYGEMLPLAVIKNCDKEGKAIFEEEIFSLVGNLPKNKIDFGNIQVGEDEFYLAGCVIDEILLEIISQGYNLNSALASKKDGLSCSLFDVEGNVVECGVAPILSFELNSKGGEDYASNFQKKFSESLMDCGEYELFVTTEGNKNTVKIRQKSAGDLRKFADAGRYYAHNILDEYQDKIKNLCLLDIDGCEFNEQETKDFLELKALQNNYLTKKFNICKGLKYEVTEDDLRDIKAIDFGENFVAVGVLKNARISIINLRRICNETKQLDSSNCQVVRVPGADGDGLIVIATRKDVADFYSRISPQIERKLRQSSSDRHTIALKNIDCNGKVTPANLRLAGKIQTYSKANYRYFERRLTQNDDLTSLSPCILNYGANNVFGIYVNNLSADGDVNREPPAFNDLCREIINSGMLYELTNAYGESRESAEVGNNCGKTTKNIKISQHR